MQCETDKATIDYEEAWRGPADPVAPWLDHGSPRRSRHLREDLRDSPWLAADLSRPARHGPVGSQGRARRPGRCAGGRAGLHRPGAARPVRARRHIGRRLSGARRRRPSPVPDRRPAAARARHHCGHRSSHIAVVPAAGAGRCTDGRARRRGAGGRRRRSGPEARLHRGVGPKAARARRAGHPRPLRRSRSKSAPIPNATVSPSIWPKWRRASRSRR